MALVPRIFRIAFFASALAGGSGAAFADDIVPGGGSPSALLPLASPFAQSPLLPMSGASDLGPLPHESGSQTGHWDFFSVRPQSNSGDFTSLLRGGPGGGGLKFHLNW
jgi:hypothetical protein